MSWWHSLFFNGCSDNKEKFIMRKIMFCLMTLLSVVAVAQVTIYLPEKGGNGIEAAERVGAWRQIYDITEPRIDVYLPDCEERVPMMLVCPGGAYEYVSVVNEGKCVAEWAMKNKIAVAVLKYRMPNGHENVPLEDAIAAMRILRDSVEAWNLLPDKIGVMGFSAGGHLAGSLMTKYVDVVSRPDFGVLVYPVLSMKSDTHSKTRRLLLGEQPTPMQDVRWTLKNCVTAQTPPCFIIACQDDKAVPISNSLDFYEALNANGVESELMILPKGGHGFGFQRHIPQDEVFHTALLEWLTTL